MTATTATPMLLDRKLYAAFFATAIAVAVFLYRQPLTIVVSFWNSEEYSHGPLVVAIALFLGWQRLAELKPAIKPAWSGVLLLFLGELFHIIGLLSTFNSAGAYGFVFTVVGLSAGFYGWSFVRALWPTFVYATFAIPLPSVLLVDASRGLQLLSSILGVDILEYMVTAVYREGNIIDLGELQLQVADACSGLRYLFPLMSFGFLAAYLLDDKLWKRVVLFLSTIPIAVSMNVARIVFIGVTVDHWGADMARGLLHEFEGWTVFMVCVLLLMAEIAVLVRIPPRGALHLELLSQLPRGALTLGAIPNYWKTGALFGFMLVAAVAPMAVTVDAPVAAAAPHKNFAEFPLQIADWRGRTKSLSPDILEQLKLTDYLLSDYSRPENRESVEFYVAYYAVQQMGAEIHWPSDCIPGAGWAVLSNDTKTLPVQWIDGKPLAVNRLLINKDGQSLLVYFWLSERGKDITNGQGLKLDILWDALVANRSDGALIRVITPVNPSESETLADQRLVRFLGAALERLPPFLPASPTGDGAERPS